MRKPFVLPICAREIATSESNSITGGGDIITGLRCASSTMTRGGGGFTSIILGATVFGLARAMGVLRACI